MSKSLTKLVCFTACILALPFSNAESQTSYPMVCRGGGNLNIRVSVTKQMTQANIFFQRASLAAGQNWNVLQPGQCSWIDRPISPTEPAQLSHNVPVTQLPSHEFLSFVWTLPGTVTSTASLEARHPYLAKLRNPGHFVVFRAYNSNHGYFIVTGFGQ